MIVYVDVLVVLNFVVNYALLLLSGRMCGGRISRLRLTLAALLGAGASLIIFLPPMAPAVNILIKIGLSVLLAAVAGGYRDMRGFLKRLLMLLVVSFVFAGLMLFFTLLGGGKSGFFYNGICYFHISGLRLLAFSVVAYVCLSLYQKLFKKSMVTRQEYTVLVTQGGRTRALPGVMDSQNNLVDLFSGTPVVIGSLSLLRELAPPGLEELAKGRLESARLPAGVRMIPCATVAGQDVLPAFRPDRLVLRCGENGEETEIQDVYLAVTASLHGAAAAKLILNPALTGRVLQKIYEGGA